MMGLINTGPSAAAARNSPDDQSSHLRSALAICASAYESSDTKFHLMVGGALTAARTTYTEITELPFSRGSFYFLRLHLLRGCSPFSLKGPAPFQRGDLWPSRQHRYQHRRK